MLSSVCMWRPLDRVGRARGEHDGRSHARGAALAAAVRVAGNRIEFEAVELQLHQLQNRPASSARWRHEFESERK